MRHSNPSLLALDLGTTTGWALLSEGKVVSGSFDMRPLEGEAIGIRFLRFRREFLNNFKSVREVYFEEVRRHEGTHSAHVYGALWGTLCAWCEQNSIPYRGVPVGTWKKHIGCKGNAGKPEVMEAIQRRGLNPDSQDEADALGILSYARKQRAAYERK